MVPYHKYIHILYSVFFSPYAHTQHTTNIIYSEVLGIAQFQSKSDKNVDAICIIYC